MEKPTRLTLTSDLSYEERDKEFFRTFILDSTKKALLEAGQSENDRKIKRPWLQYIFQLFKKNISGLSRKYEVEDIEEVLIENGYIIVDDAQT